MGLCTDDALLWPTQKCLKIFNLINFDPLWAWQNLWGYGRIFLTKFWPLGTPRDPSSDHCWVPCCLRKCKCLLMKFSENGHMAISSADLLYFITELVTRNPNLGIPTLEDGLFANLLIVDRKWLKSMGGRRLFKKTWQFGCRVAHPYSSTPIDLINFFLRFAPLSLIWLTLEAK